MSAQHIIYCRKCLMPNSRPRVVFDANGVCNACHHMQEKKQIDWAARREEFFRVVEPYRGRGTWDCVVPWSGGKDSSSVAHKLKFEFGLNPLLVTYSPMIPNEVGVANREALIQQGFDHLMVRPNQKALRRLARRFFIERGNPKVAWEAGVNAIPLQVAVNYGIPLVFYAEHGESEYGGRVLSEESRRTRNFTEVIEHHIGDDPRNWVDDEIQSTDLLPYIYPPLDDVRRAGVTAFYFSYFHNWDIYRNYQYVSEQFAAAGFPFRLNAKGRTDGTFTNYDSLDDKIDDVYYHLQFVKFGFGRALRDAARLIQNGHLTREQGLEYARKYDDEHPREFFADTLDYLRLTEAEYEEIVDQHRNPEIWKRENGCWVLRYPPQ
jgi:N-acetyl sugar amidotransferase